MNEKERIILVWVLAFGSLLVALLYSPLGSPDMYRKKVYFAEYQGVQFTDGIKNAPKKLKMKNKLPKKFFLNTKKRQQAIKQLHIHQILSYLLQTAIILSHLNSLKLLFRRIQELKLAVLEVLSPI
jgi:hypothetical protein